MSNRKMALYAVAVWGFLFLMIGVDLLYQEIQAQKWKAIKARNDRALKEIKWTP